MKVRDVMTQQVYSINANETVDAAARTLTHYNIGVLPVRGSDGSLQGVVTDRDLVIRCMATGRQPEKTRVQDVMTGKVQTVDPDMELPVAAHLMGRLQVRRLPVVKEGRLCGMVSLGDLAKREDSIMDAADALSDISENLSTRG